MNPPQTLLIMCELCQTHRSWLPNQHSQRACWGHGGVGAGWGRPVGLEIFQVEDDGVTRWRDWGDLKGVVETKSAKFFVPSLDMQFVSDERENSQHPETKISDSFSVPPNTVHQSLNLFKHSLKLHVYNEKGPCCKYKHSNRK